MIPACRVRTLNPGEVDRIRAAWLEGVSVDNIRARFRLSSRLLHDVVADLPKRQRTKQTLRTTTRIPGDLE